MTRIHARLSIVFLLVAGMPAYGAAAETPPREWRFTALLDDKVIGYQSFRLVEQGALDVLISDARYNVTFLFMNVYHYRHEDREVWHGDCLDRIDSRTDDDGAPFAVHGERKSSGFVVETANAHARLPPCVMTFAYWNPRILAAKRLLNAQTGEYLNIDVAARGRETILVADVPRPAERFELKSEKFTIDLWYSLSLEWLGLETTTASGRRLRYRIDSHNG